MVLQAAPPSPPILHAGENAALNELHELYRSVIGPDNCDYYLKLFMQFDRPGRMKMPRSRPALHYFSIWLVYRKMWKWAIFYPVGLSLTALAFVASLPAAKRFWFLPLFFLAVAGALLFLLPRMANRLYYRHCKSLIRKAQRSCPAFHEQIFYLARAGGTCSIPFTVVCFIGMLLIAFISLTVGMSCLRFQYHTHQVHILQACITVLAAEACS